MSSLKGRVYTVTGAASGIGQAVAVRLAELGAAGIAISDVNQKGLEATQLLCQSSTSGSVCVNLQPSRRQSWRRKDSHYSRGRQ